MYIVIDTLLLSIVNLPSLNIATTITTTKTTSMIIIIFFLQIYKRKNKEILGKYIFGNSGEIKIQNTLNVLISCIAPIFILVVIRFNALLIAAKNIF